MTRLTLDQIETKANEHPAEVALHVADTLLSEHGYAYTGVACRCPDGGAYGHRLTCGYSDPEPPAPDPQPSLSERLHAHVQGIQPDPHAAATVYTAEDQLWRERAGLADPHAAAMAAGMSAVEKALEPAPLSREPEGLAGEFLPPTAEQHIAYLESEVERLRHHPTEIKLEALEERIRAFHEGLLAAGFSDPAPTQVGKLAEQRDALADALEAAQWGDHSPAGFAQCPTCQRKQQRGHAPGCAIGSALRKAGRS